MAGRKKTDRKKFDSLRIFVSRTAAPRLKAMAMGTPSKLMNEFLRLCQKY